MGIREDFFRDFFQWYEPEVKIRPMISTEIALWGADWAMKKCIKSADTGASFEVEHQIPGALRELAKELSSQSS